jgi:hypothetical protein
MTEDERIAREDIRATLSNYTIASDVRDPDLFLAQFTDDATFEVTPFPGAVPFKCDGIAAMRQWVTGWSKEPFKSGFALHNLTASQVEMTGKDTAKAKTYFTTFTGIGPDHAGVYIDTFARKGDRWLITSRIVQAQWLSPNRPN